ncbi:class I SAM-dependent RNA methyltransferase [Amaricoccus macauensis]|uniref:class I SAM-dependent RNA methyltransferase n=1 Tax=Amaricoccus macauensis TaxID=57001 RepID=UPI003C7CD38C
MHDAQGILIERLGQDGDGIAGETRIPGALPGEVWSIEPPALLRGASQARVEPKCPLFGSCGGCSLQHASPSFLAAWKGDVIARALLAHGLETEIQPTRMSLPWSRRRAGLSARRTKKTVRVGFHARRSEEIVPLTTCEVVEPAILASIPVLERLTVIAAPRAREIRIQVTHGPAGLDVDLRETKELDGKARADLAALARDAGIARLSLAGETLFLAHPPIQQIGRARVVPPPGAFLQATQQGEAALTDAVREIVGEARRVVDLFSGCGTFALPLAEGAEVHAVEGAADLTGALDRAWRGATGLKRVTTEVRDLFRRPLMADELDRFDAVVMDPPRAGAEAQSAEIARSRLSTLAYVSCNPATFARDAAVLVASGFRLEWVRPVDQFLWSGHVELVAHLVR